MTLLAPALNALQTFLAEGNAQTVAVLTEKVQIGGETYDATFGDAVMMPVMTPTGYQDHLVTPVKISRPQFASPPASHGSLKRISTDRTMFIQIVDISNPVIFTLICTDRDL